MAQAVTSTKKKGGGEKKKKIKKIQMQDNTANSSDTPSPFREELDLDHSLISPNDDKNVWVPFRERVGSVSTPKPPSQFETQARDTPGRTLLPASSNSDRSSPAASTLKPLGTGKPSATSNMGMASFVTVKKTKKDGTKIHAGWDVSQFDITWQDKDNLDKSQINPYEEEVYSRLASKLGSLSNMRREDVANSVKENKTKLRETLSRRLFTQRPTPQQIESRGIVPQGYFDQGHVCEEFFFDDIKIYKYICLHFYMHICIYVYIYFFFGIFLYIHVIFFFWWTRVVYFFFFLNIAKKIFFVTYEWKQNKWTDQ
ncbi:hypothetical protein RFI_12471 [Reticulomyxa filosa]|uniref:Uncharacterized protein n=1 Tax=Reticulomyxa filosa TaxID=46433 RepID=X6NFC0_RETFI|nr:hypothetical protein RFI_12471 [Reticulomyxa filosa]|eukprot:ETO24686.1 hypothetical protein RFI_12471 [Reticulomyxa filosa]